MQAIEVCSVEQGNAREVCRVHTTVCELLNEVCCGRCQYVGKVRQALITLRDRLEAVILGGDYWKEFAFPPSWVLSNILAAQYR